MQKTCSKCQQSFGCINETRGCWCENVQLNAAILQYLEENYENCLCPVCLKEFEENKVSAK